MSKLRGCLLLTIGLPAAGIALLLCLFFYQLYLHTSVREHIVFTIPGPEIEVGHSRIGTHPMMAEYDRDLTFFESGKPIVTAPLIMDTCGGYPMNCYLIETPERILMRLDDAVVEHLVDFTHHVVYAIIHAKEKSYYGKLNNGDFSWAMIGDDVTICGEKALLLDELIGDAPEKYVGRVDGKVGQLRFIPSTEASELPIDHLFDW